MQPLMWLPGVTWGGQMPVAVAGWAPLHAALHLSRRVVPCSTHTCYCLTADLCFCLLRVQAFAVSDQAVRLVKQGWFQEQAEPSGVSTLRNPAEPKHERPVIVAGKDQGEVDNDYFLIPVNILDHEGALYSAFPIENRLLPQGVWRLTVWHFALKWCSNSDASQPSQQ